MTLTAYWSLIGWATPGCFSQSVTSHREIFPDSSGSDSFTSSASRPRISASLTQRTGYVTHPPNSIRLSSGCSSSSSPHLSHIACA